MKRVILGTSAHNRKLTRLLNTMFAQKVKKAVENGELDWDNIHEWTTAYNDNFESESLEEEVSMLLNHYRSELADRY